MKINHLDSLVHACVCHGGGKAIFSTVHLWRKTTHHVIKNHLDVFSICMHVDRSKDEGSTASSLCLSLSLSLSLESMMMIQSHHAWSTPIDHTLTTLFFFVHIIPRPPARVESNISFNPPAFVHCPSLIGPFNAMLWRMALTLWPVDHHACMHPSFGVS